MGTNARYLGLRDGPHRLAVKFIDFLNNTFKIVQMEPKRFEKRLAKQERDEKEAQEETLTCYNVPVMRVGQNKIRIEMPTEDLLEEVVDVSAGLSDPTRILYPKVA